MISHNFQAISKVNNNKINIKILLNILNMRYLSVGQARASGGIEMIMQLFWLCLFASFASAETCLKY